jgi:hypothetical protein
MLTPSRDDVRWIVPELPVSSEKIIGRAGMSIEEGYNL